jgi:hypothetical protein
MASLDLTNTLKTLQGERARIEQEIVKLDKAIAVIRELASTEAGPASNGHPKKRTLSAAARQKIAQAQKLRWAKFRKQQNKQQKPAA